MEFRKPMIRPGQSYPVIVTHVDSPDQFYCQLKDSSDQLNELMDAIAEYCSMMLPTQGLVEETLIGMPCLALYSSDSVWYRARVTGLEASGAVEVQFVDYGNHERLQRNRLRDITNGFMQLPFQAVPCTMQGIGCRPGEMWTQDESDKFFDLSSSESIAMKIVELAQGQDRFIIQLIEGETNLNLTFGQMTGKVLRAPPAPSASAAAAMVPRPIRGTGSTLSVSAPPKTQGITLGAFYKVYVVYALGPGKFYCQLDEQGDTLESFMDDLNREYGKLAPNERALMQPVEGMACCTIYPEDQRWHRGVITSLKGAQSEVRFIDYGNTETAVTNQLKELSGRHLLVPEFSFECSIHGVKPLSGVSWPEDTGYQFEQLTLEKLMVLCVKEQPSPGVYKVELVDSTTSQNVADQMIMLGAAVKDSAPVRSPAGRGGGVARRTAPGGNADRSMTDPKTTIISVTFAVNSEYDVLMGHINSPNQFWCQPAEHAEALETMMAKLEEDYNNLSPGDLKIHHPWVGQVVAARFTVDQRWYRAEIISIERSSVKVKYVDYGNSEWLSSERVRVLKSNYTSLPCQAVECSLDGVCSAEAEWSEGAIGTFEETTFEKDLIFKVTKSKASAYHGSLVQKDTGKIVENIMVKLGLAKVEEDAASVEPSLAYAQPVGRPITKSLSPKAAGSAPLSRASSSSVEEVPPFKKQKLTAGERFKCQISWVNNPLDFFCQRLDAEELLQEQMDAMNELYNSFSEAEQGLPNATVGQSCVARYSADKNWYRASIMKIKGSEARVLFVDYGNAEIVKITKLKFVAKEFRTLPEQAIRCGIEGIEKPANSWNPQIAGLFQQVCAQQVMCSVISQNEKVNLVQIEDANKQSIGAKLVELGVPASPSGSLAGSGQQGFGGPSRFGGQNDRQPRGFGGREDRPPRGFGSGSNDGDRPQRGFGSGSNDGDRPQRGFGNGGGDRPRRGFGNDDDSQPRGGRFGDDRKGGGRFGGSDNHDDRRGFAGGDRKGGRFGDDQNSQGGRFGRDNRREGGFGGSSGFGAPSAADAAGEDEWGDPSLAAAAAPPASSVFQSTSGVAAKYKSMDQNQLLVGYKIKAEIVHAESTAEFWIQLSGHMEKLDALMGQLEERFSQASGDLYSLKNPTEGSPCVAKYTVDGGWYRAKVLSATPQKIHVFFVDYGNTDWVPRSDVKELNKECAELAMQAMRCSLAGVEFSSPEATAKLNELTENKTLIVEIRDNLPSNGISVLLKDELGTNINDVVKAILTSTTYPPAVFEQEVEMEAVVSHVNSPGSFYVQRADQLDDLATLADAMLVYYDDPATSKPIETAAVGFPCIAKFSEDGAYYRAVVSSVNSTKAVVTFIDYGNQDTVEAKSLRVPSTEHLSMPAFAVHCHFSGLPTTGWTDKDKVTLDTLIDVESLTVVLKGEKVPAAAILTVNGEKLNDKFSAPNATSIVPTAKSAPSAPENVTANVAPPVMTLDTIYPPAKPQTNTSLSVFVTHANSAKSFYVQLESDSDAIVEFVEKIQASYSSLGPTDLILENHFEGKACVAKFSEDEAWYRAFITSLKGSQVTVRFIDYGNSDTIDRTTLKSPTAELASQPCYAIHCCLAGVKATADQNEEILAMLNDEEAIFTMTITSLGNPCQVKLAVGGVDLNAKYGGVVAETSAPVPTVQQAFLPPSVPFGKEVSVYSPHADSPASFYLQPAELEEQATALADQLVAVYGSLNEGDLAFTSPAVGSSCVAKYDEDESWYRARVISMNGETSEVLFVDYGNTATVTVSGLKAPTDALLKIPIMAIPCTLEGFQEGNCTDDLKEKFNTLLMEAEITAQFINNTEELVSVKLIHEGNDLADMFADVEVKAEKTSVNKAAPVSAEVSPTKENQTFPPPSIPAGENVHVFSTHSDSPTNFYLQLAELEEILTALADTLVAEYGSLVEGQNILKTPEIGSSCVAKFDEDDNWYRANVKSISGDVCEVLFVDYGNSASVAVSALKVPTKDLMNMPIMAIPCALAGVKEGGITDELKTQFNELVLEAELTAHFIDAKKRPVPVTLLQEGKNLADMFPKADPEAVVHEGSDEIEDSVEVVASNEGEDSSEVEVTSEAVHATTNYAETAFKKGEKVEVVVTHVDHPALFWVRPAAVESQLESLTEQIRERNENQTVESAENSLKVGDLIVAKYDDDEWYRAKVMDIDGEQVTVYFSDFGNTDAVSLNRVYPAQDDLLVLPSQAQQCLLAGIIPTEELWSAEAVETFQDLALEKKVLAIILDEVETQNGTSKALAVKLLNVGISIADQLVNEGHASVSEQSELVGVMDESLNENLECVEVTEQQTASTSVEITNKEHLNEADHADPTSRDVGLNDSLILPLNEEIEVIINCVHIPGGLFDVYPSEKPLSDDVAQCQLTSALPDEEDWSTELQTFFCDFIDKKVVIKALKLEEGVYTVEMLDHGVSVGEILKQKILSASAKESPEEEARYSDDCAEADTSEGKNEKREEVAEIAGSTELDKDSLGENFQNGEVHDVEIPIRSPEAGDQAAQKFSDKSPLFATYERGDSLSVQLVYGDGPEKFVCRLENEEELTKLSGDLESHFANDDITVLPKDSATIGQLCVVKTSGSPAVWCRGVVIEVGGQDCKVKLVDHGKPEEVAYTNLYQFPEEFMKPPAQCATFQLHGVITEGDDTQETKVDQEGSGDNIKDAQEEKDIAVAFKELCRAGPLVATIVSRTGVGYGALYQVVLCNKDGVNINSEVVSKSHAWVAPAASFSVDPEDYDKLAEEQDVLENSFLEVSYMKDNSIGDIEEAEDSENSSKVETNELKRESADNSVEAKEVNSSPVDGPSEKNEKDHDVNCNKDLPEKFNGKEATMDS